MLRSGNVVRDTPCGCTLLRHRILSNGSFHRKIINRRHDTARSAAVRIQDERLVVKELSAHADNRKGPPRTEDILNVARKTSIVFGVIAVIYGGMDLRAAAYESSSSGDSLTAFERKQLEREKRREKLSALYVVKPLSYQNACKYHD